MKTRSLVGITLVLFAFNTVQAGPFSFTETWNNLAEGPGTSHGLAIGDFDNDLDLDISTTRFHGTHSAYVVENTGASFALKAQIVTPANDWGSTDFIDLGNDGDLDWVQGHANSNTSSYALINNGASFATSVTAAVTNNGVNRKDRVFAVDYDADGFEDLIETGNGGVQMFRNDGTGSFPTVGGDVSINNGWAYNVAFGNFNGDAFLDMVVSIASSDFRIYTQDSLGGFTDSGVTVNDSVANEAQAFYLDFADMDGDGDDDIVSSLPGQSINVFKNNGTSFDLDHTISGGYHDVRWADLDNDGDKDLVAGGRITESISAWENLGGGVFSTAPTWITGFDGIHIEIGDADNDGDLDIFSVDQDVNTLRYFQNNAVPEPSSWLLVSMGLLGIAANRRKS